MLSDTAVSYNPFRRVNRRARASAPISAEDTSRFADWEISGFFLVNADGTRFRVARHGIDKINALRLAEDAAVTVLYGDFPELTDITTDRARVTDALEQVQTRGDLFSVYASVYRSGARSVLLLDYLR